jgi:hypothetical protein
VSGVQFPLAAPTSSEGRYTMDFQLLTVKISYETCFEMFLLSILEINGQSLLELYYRKFDELGIKDVYFEIGLLFMSLKYSHEYGNATLGLGTWFKNWQLFEKKI